MHSPAAPVVGLIDTGAILAILDRNDRWHVPCLQAYSNVRLPLLTTEAVLTEAFHLIRRTARDADGIWRLLRSGAIRMAEIRDEELPQIQRLMDEYADRPMDFADATLVHVAGRESLNVVLTVDRDDFQTYRLPGRKRFAILPTTTDVR
jgi:uncharacterized protein